MKLSTRMGMVALALAGMAQSAQGLVFLNSSDPNFNNTRPTDDKSGPWDAVGSYNGGGGGTAISSRWFMSATHVGTGGTFSLGGVNYNVIQDYTIPGTDMTFHKVDHDFTTWANLYTGDPRTIVTGSQNLLLIGEGYGRGTAQYNATTGALQGWAQGGSRHKAWALNTVDRISYSASAGTYYYYSYFKNNSLGDSEAMVASGDSGGGAFIQKNGTWYLLGAINYAVTIPGYPWAAINLSQTKGWLPQPFLSSILSGTDIGSFDALPAGIASPVPEPEDAALAACAALGGYFIGRKGGGAKKKSAAGTRGTRSAMPGHRRCEAAAR